MAKSKVVVLLLCLGLAHSAWGYVFDSIDVSSKARGMGAAWVASADDATAIFYNPACLVQVESANVFASMLRPNSQSFETLTYFAYGMPIGKRQHAGISFRSFGVEYQGVDLLDEWTFSLAYALRVMEDIHSSLYLGGALNLYTLDFGRTSTVDLGSETTFGLDIGVLGILRDRTRLGILLKNINEPSVGATTREPLPQWVTVGVAYQPYYGVVTELDLRALRGENVEVHMGMQFMVTDFLKLRFGFQTEPNSVTGGFSIGHMGFHLDYAYSSHPVLPGTHHVALRGTF